MQNYKTNCFNKDKFTIKCGDHTIKFDSPVVMGILNLTPDSFYDGGSYISEESVLHRAEQILSEGAEIIDLGAYSTRPGAANVSLEEEYQRMKPAVKAIRKQFPKAVLSIDTFRAELSRRIVDEFGACIINDISGGSMDEKMYETVGELSVPYIMMHIQGTPQTMQQKPEYEDVVAEIIQFYQDKIEHVKQFGIDNLILDPGFGFGKTIDHNYEIMARLNEFSVLNAPLLVGISRKSMIYKFLGGDPSSSLNGTTALHMQSLDRGANILRVHDVKEAVECVRLYEKVQSFQK